MKRTNFIYRNGLLIFAIGFFLIFWIAQAVTGWYEYNTTLNEGGANTLNFGQYLFTGHFVETTFENWESEFLQMFLYVLFTVWLRQWGSSESKKLDSISDVDKVPVAGPNSPWPVKQGGWTLKIYQNSLSLAFLILFIISLGLHAKGSYNVYVVEETLKHHKIDDFLSYLTQSRFWFESFQNWQSEFLSIASIVGFSIFLRQKGSPESKPVDMPHSEIP